jgi:monoamine oxidase
VSGSAAIVTLPLGVLKAGGVRFSPPLPQAKRAAIDGLGLTAAVKLFYRFARPVLPPGADALSVEAGLPRFFWVSTPPGAPDQVLTGWAVHAQARELLALGEEAALARGLATLQSVLGPVAPVARRLSEWETDPFTRGAYSMTPAGAAGLRAALAEPAHGRLFWAGEATASDAEASTVHGAYTSGLRAAEAVQRQWPALVSARS